jgi:hypothetical protein
MKPHKRNRKQFPKEKVLSTEYKTPASADILEEPRLHATNVFMNVGKDDVYIPDKRPENEHRYKTNELWNSDRMNKAHDQEDKKHRRHERDEHLHSNYHVYHEDAGQEQNDIKPRTGNKMLRKGVVIPVQEETM